MASSARNSRTGPAYPEADQHAGEPHGQIVNHALGRMGVRLHREHRDPTAVTVAEIETSDS